MLTKQEQEILDNAPIKVELDNALNGAGLALHNELSKYGDISGGMFNNMKGCLRVAIETYLADLRKKGKIVWDAVNWANAEWNTSKHNRGVIVQGPRGEFMFAESTTNPKHCVCNEQEFNQCVKEMSEIATANELMHYRANNSPLEPAKPRTNIEYVPMATSHPYKMFKAMEDDGDVYVICENGECEGMSGCVINLANAIGDEVSIYRKVETEIKTEKRWITYNTKTDECYPCGETQIPAEHCQIIEITVEV